jgi:hypothetical protein
MSDAYITKEVDGWKFSYGTKHIHERTFPTREEAEAWAEMFSDETGATFVLHIQKV